MKKFLLFLIIIFNSVLLLGNTEELSVSVKGDTVKFIHDSVFLNCGSKIRMDIYEENNIIQIFEVDTSSTWYFCECYFDLCMQITGLEQGRYTVEFFGCVDTTHFTVIDTTYYGSVEFSVGNNKYISSENSGCLYSVYKDNPENSNPGIGLIVSSYSDCKEMDSVSDSANLYVDTSYDILSLFISDYKANCCFEPDWDYWLINDTFHVEVIDTGAPCDCECLFDFEAKFGYFESGNYVLDFIPDIFEYRNFSIGSKLTAEGINNNIQLTWNINDINCGTAPAWNSIYRNDTLFVTVKDTGDAYKCLCPFEFKALFGPFNKSEIPIVFNAWDEYLDTLSCVINPRTSPATDSTIKIIDTNQSDCYHVQDIDNNSQITPNKFQLFAPYPNPFNPSTIINYSISRQSQINLSIYNLKGECVKLLLDAKKSEGSYSINWKPQNIPTGFYIIKMTDGINTQTQKVNLIK